jgi:hypothetical protein
MRNCALANDERKSAGVVPDCAALHPGYKPMFGPQGCDLQSKNPGIAAGVLHFRNRLKRSRFCGAA